MSYRPFEEGPFLRCWSTGAEICLEELDGTVTKYPCKLGVVIEPQVNAFRGQDAIWCLRDHGILYVGRNDSTFSGFRESDGLLVRYGAWDYPTRRVFEMVGQYRGSFVYLDSRDSRTIYVQGADKGLILRVPLTVDVIEHPALADALSQLDRLTIYTKGGLIDGDTAGSWVSTPRAVGTDSPIYL